MNYITQANFWIFLGGGCGVVAVRMIKFGVYIGAGEAYFQTPPVPDKVGTLVASG